MFIKKAISWKQWILAVNHDKLTLEQLQTDAIMIDNLMFE